MPVTLSTTLKNIELLENKRNTKLIFQFYNYLQSNNTSESYQNQNLKALITFARFLGPNTDFYQISKKENILAFLDTKIMLFESLDFLYVPSRHIQESIRYYTNILDGKLPWKIHAYGVWVACIKLSKEPYILLADHIERKT